MQELIKALIAAKKDFAPIAKNKKNPHFKNQYASLDAILEAVEPALHANGLVLTQIMEVGEFPILVTRLLHESGQSLDSNYSLPSIPDPQKFGGAITYARRYSICALLSITADDDDDGNSVKDSTKAGCISSAQVKLLQIKLKELNYTAEMMKLFKDSLGVASAKDILKDDFDRAMSRAQDVKIAEQYRAQTLVAA